MGNVDEDELTGGISDSDVETTVATGSIASLFQIGADQPGSYGINASMRHECSDGRRLMLNQKGLR